MTRRSQKSAGAEVDGSRKSPAQLMSLPRWLSRYLELGLCLERSECFGQVVLDAATVGANSLANSTGPSSERLSRPLWLVRSGRACPRRKLVTLSPMLRSTARHLRRR